VGRLIGKAGATVRELESRTGCRVRTTAQKLGQDSDEAMTEISIRATARGLGTVCEVAEARCWRVAQLLLEDGLSLEAALAQADEERKEHERLEAAREEEAHFESVVRRVRVGFPEFQAEDVRAALRESCLNEDDAVDMLMMGYRAASLHKQDLQPADSAADSAARTVDTEEREEFPLLPTVDTASTIPSRSKPCGGKWCSAQPARRSATADLSSADAFPALPAPCPPRPAVRRCARPQQQIRRRT